MYVVIFRATVGELGDDYSALAEQLRLDALEHHGCLDFASYTEGDQEVTLSYWPDSASVVAWKAVAEHRAAQVLGRDRFYSAYSIQVARIERDYRWP